MRKESQIIEYAESLLSRVSPKCEREYIKALTQAYNRATIALNATNGIYTKKRLLIIISQITSELKAINAKFGQVLPYQMEEIVNGHIKYTEEELALALKHADVQATLYSIPKSMMKEFTNIKSINYYRVDAKGVRHQTVTSMDAMIGSIADTNAKKVKGIILAEGAIGSSPESIARKINPYVSGNTVRRDIRGVTQSLLKKASENANLKFFSENSEYINYYLYNSVLDSRTTLICRQLDNKKFDKPCPTCSTPQHFRCRSSLLAIPEGYNIPDKRPAVFPDKSVKMVSADLSYNEVVEIYPEIANKSLINTSTYLSKLAT